jgi:WXG100 family type VII secretion target
VNDRLVIDFGALQHGSAEISNALRRLESQLGELEAAAQPLVAGWEGSAKDAYAQRQAQWRGAAGDLSDALRGIRAALDESAADYRQTELRNEELFR